MQNPWLPAERHLLFWLGAGRKMPVLHCLGDIVTALPVVLGTFQGSSTQNSLGCLVGMWHVQSGWWFLHFSVLSIPFPIYSGNLFSPVLPVKRSQREIIDPILLQDAYLVMLSEQSSHAQTFKDFAQDPGE